MFLGGDYLACVSLFSEFPPFPIFVFSIIRSVGPTDTKAFRKELRALAERERALEEKLQAVDRSVSKILEALEKKVSALTERQKELEGKLTPAKAV